MTPDKSIEILSDFAYVGTNAFGQDWYDALKLGIEALKWRAEIKKVIHPSKLAPLPGETEPEGKRAV